MTVRKNSNILKSLLVFVLIFSLLPCAVLAKGKNDRNGSRLSDTNPDTGFSVYIEDDADLLNDSEELELLDDMYKITEYASAAFKTTDNNPYSDTDTFAEEYYRTMFGRDTGVVFVIDMDKRYIFIFSDGRSYGKITKSKWVKDGGEWYYLKADGYMAANEWAKDGKGWMYMDGSGKITKSKWIQYKGYWYYLKADGYMATGTQTIGGTTYNFD